MGNCYGFAKFLNNSRNISYMTADNTPWLSLDKETLLCKVIDVYDGDTITVILPFNTMFYKKKCRLYGIDCAEIRTKDLEEKKCGYDAKRFLSDHIHNKQVWIYCGDWDKYGRLLITIYTNKQDIGNFDKSINKLMLDNNHAYSYDGTKKQQFQDWKK